MARIRSKTGKNVEVMQNQIIHVVTPEGIEVSEKQARFFAFGNPKTIERVPEEIEEVVEEQGDIPDTPPPATRTRKNKSRH